MAASPDEKRILDALEAIRAAGEVYLEVPVADGRMLRLLIESARARNVVEIGTSTGYSGLWISLGLLKTGGHLTTFEADAGRAALARKHFDRAGVSPMVTLVEGDAHRTISRLNQPIDVAFIDADKEGYPDYLRHVLPLVRTGGLILAHNVDMAPEYVREVTTNAALETLFYMQGRGLGITLKK